MCLYVCLVADILLSTDEITMETMDEANESDDDEAVLLYYQGLETYDTTGNDAFTIINRIH